MALMFFLVTKGFWQSPRTRGYVIITKHTARDNDSSWSITWNFFVFGFVTCLISLSGILRWPYWLSPFQIVVKKHARGLPVPREFSAVLAARKQIRQQNCDFKLKPCNPIVSWALCCDPQILGLRVQDEGFSIPHNILDFILWTVCFLRAKLQLSLKRKERPLNTFLRQRRGRAPWGLSVCRDLVITSAAAFAIVQHAQSLSLLHVLGGLRRAAGSAEWPIAWLQPACSSGGRAAGIQQIFICIWGCAVCWQQLRCADGARLAVIRTWLEGTCTNKGSVPGKRKDWNSFRRPFCKKLPKMATSTCYVN